MDNLVEIYCVVDDFTQIFLPQLHQQMLTTGEKKRLKPSKLSVSEVMTLIILFHQSDYRTLKHFYLNYVSLHLRDAFPKLVSYSQFVRLEQTILMILCEFLNSRKGKNTGISYIDSTKLAVCHNRRINRNKVFSGIAARGKTTMGWFFGFKLHLVVNDVGELLGFCLTPGNTDDRKPVEKIVKQLTGKLFGDRGYISKQLFEDLLQQGLQLITTVRKNMKNRLMPVFDKLLLRKRFIIETINDQLKNISQIEHSRHRSINNFMVNLVSGLIAYTFQPKKPSLKLSEHEFEAVNQLTLICN
jgi:hypothetical protein